MTDFDKLIALKATLTARLEDLQVEKTALYASIEVIALEILEIEAQLTTIKVQAEELFAATFGKSPAPEPPPIVSPPQTPVVSPVAAPRKPDNSIVFDEPVAIKPNSLPDMQF